MKKTIVTISLSCLLAVNLIAQKTPVVAVVDVERILNEYSEYQVALGKVRGTIAPVQGEMRRMQSEMKSIIDQGREAATKFENPASSEEAREAAQKEALRLDEELRKAQVDLNQFRQQAQELAQTGRKEKLAPLQQKIIKLIESIARDRDIDLVFQKNSVVFFNESMEISDDVIVALNAADGDEVE